MKTKSIVSVGLLDDTHQSECRYGKSNLLLWLILVTMLPTSLLASVWTKAAYEQGYTELRPIAASSTNPLQRPGIAFESEPPMPIVAGYTKTIAEVIAEDQLIIESKWENDTTAVTKSPLEQMIREDNQIIESSITNEVFPLDFDNVNKTYAGF